MLASVAFFALLAAGEGSSPAGPLHARPAAVAFIGISSGVAGFRGWVPAHATPTRVTVSRRWVRSPAVLGAVLLAEPMTGSLGVACLAAGLRLATARVSATAARSLVTRTIKKAGLGPPFRRTRDQGKNARWKMPPDATMKNSIGIDSIMLMREARNAVRRACSSASTPIVAYW